MLGGTDIITVSAASADISMDVDILDLSALGNIQITGDNYWYDTTGYTYVPSDVTITLPGDYTWDGTYTTQNTIDQEIRLDAGGQEMLRITKEGFYVRGQLVPQDHKEAAAVYTAVRQWMTYNIMTQW
jgi:hypothetical protein